MPHTTAPYGAENEKVDTNGSQVNRSEGTGQRIHINTNTNTNINIKHVMQKHSLLLTRQRTATNNKQQTTNTHVMKTHIPREGLLVGAADGSTLGTNVCTSCTLKSPDTAKE
jgi:hypothetical protein